MCIFFPYVLLHYIKTPIYINFSLIDKKIKKSCCQCLDLNPTSQCHCLTIPSVNLKQSVESPFHYHQYNYLLAHFLCNQPPTLYLLSQPNESSGLQVMTTLSPWNLPCSWLDLTSVQEWKEREQRKEIEREEQKGK